MPDRFTEDQMRRLASNAVHKIDLLGTRGATLVTTDELVAMACLLAASGTLIPGKDRVALPNPNKPKGDAI